MSITPIQYLSIENISVCYSPYYIAKVFLQKEIAKVTTIYFDNNSPDSVYEADPFYWFMNCTRSVLLKVEWMDTEIAYDFIQSIRDIQLEKTSIHDPFDMSDDAPLFAEIYPNNFTDKPWHVTESNYKDFVYHHPKSEILINPCFDHVIVDEEEYAQDYDEDYDPNDTPATVIGKARARYMMERAQVFGEEEDDFERRMDDDDDGWGSDLSKDTNGDYC
jgi:hypothetical protein